MMKILAHRGLWNCLEEQNSIDSLIEAIKNGYGIETDIRDYKGKLVISHNIADDNCPPLEHLLANYSDMGSDAYLALNIKADGLQGLILELVEQYSIENYFLFDMSIPEMVVNHRERLKFFTRHSDVEKECVLYDCAEGVWLDSFYDELWMSEEMIHKHLADGKKIGIISPEIHGYGHKAVWHILFKNNFFMSDRVMLCTDMPGKAKEYFQL